MRYRIQEGAFDLPDTLHDQSVNVFTATPSGTSPFNLVITRSVPRAERLDDHVQAEIDLMTQGLVGFTFLWKRAHTLGGQPARIVAATLDGPNGLVEQRQIVCFTPHNRSLTITATARQAFSPEQLEELNAFAASFVFGA